MTKYRFMEKHRNEFRVGKMAQVLEVSASGYYDWYRKGCQDRKEKDKPMIEEIRKVQEANRYRSGSPKVYRELNEAGIKIGHGKVERLMRENSLNCRTRKAFRTTTRADETKTPAPDVLKRDFTADAPDLKWVSDITYVPSASGWLYLCVFIDLFSRRVIGWALSERIDAQLVCDAFREAMEERGAPEGVIVHSDRGSQYTSHAFRRMLKRSNAIQSMSRRGNPWDNAVAESFFSTVKTEEIDLCLYADYDDAELSLTNYLEVYYNRRRKHSSIGWHTPVAFERLREEKCA